LPVACRPREVVVVAIFAEFVAVLAFCRIADLVKSLSARPEIT
jgi:hypothetical protein